MTPRSPSVDAVPKIGNERAEIESTRQRLEDEHNATFADKRGGEFFMVAGVRKHTEDLTSADREQLNLPPLTPTTE